MNAQRIVRGYSTPVGLLAGLVISLLLLLISAAPSTAAPTAKGFVAEVQTGGAGDGQQILYSGTLAHAPATCPAVGGAHPAFLTDGGAAPITSGTLAIKSSGGYASLIGQATAKTEAFRTAVYSHPGQRPSGFLHLAGSPMHFDATPSCLRVVGNEAVVGYRLTIPPTITSIAFHGSPRHPVIVIHGHNFGPRPNPDPSTGTSNLGKCGTIKGKTGSDFGGQLWLDDHNQKWSAGYLPFVDCMGLRIVSYSESRIKLRLGSFYSINYGARNGYTFGVYKLAPGDHVTLYVHSAHMTVTVDY